MEAAENIASTSVKKRKHLSAITNGTRLFQAPPRKRKHTSSAKAGDKLFDPETADLRTRAGMRFRDTYEQILEDLGGSAHLSEGQRQLARRAAILSNQCELMEIAAVAGEPFDVDCYGQITDRLGRCFQRLGLKRVARDVTPTLDQYVKHRALDPLPRGRPGGPAEAPQAPLDDKRECDGA